MTGIAWRTLRTPVGGSRAIRTLGRGPSESPRSTSTACKIGPVDALTELGILLRRWRERVTPADVGLPAGTGRRVRGLRRQEVAQLSGVSADYLVQLEQGRATSPSTQVLAALARALRLSNFERDHLLRLGGYTPPAEHAPTLSAAWWTNSTPHPRRFMTCAGIPWRGIRCGPRSMATHSAGQRERET